MVLQSTHAREQGPGPHNTVAALVDPVCGLPLLLKRFRGDTDENYGSDQQFVLPYTDKTAVLDLRATVERPPSSLAPGGRTDPAAAASEARSAGFEPLEPYPGKTTDRWRCRCMCNTDITLTLTSIRGGRTACGTCSQGPTR